MIKWESCDALERDPEKLGGVWIFRDTRVPVSALFANLRDGATVAEFLEWFPGVAPWQVEAVLDVVCRCLESSGRRIPTFPCHSRESGNPDVITKQP